MDSYKHLLVDDIKEKLENTNPKEFFSKRYISEIELDFFMNGGS